MTPNEKTYAQNLIERGEIDQAIVIYQRLKPYSADTLHTLGILYGQKKGDQYSAIDYYQQALQIKEENGDDVTNTLTGLAIAYHNLGDYDSSFIYHLRTLNIRESNPNIDQIAVANSLLGLANACSGQGDFLQALIYAQRALTLNMSIASDNDRQIGSNLVILANIYHLSGDDIHALKLSKQALTRLERCSSSNLQPLATLLNNIGTIQVSLGLLDDALLTFIRAMAIYEKILPKGHHDRITIENNMRKMAENQQKNAQKMVFQCLHYAQKLLLI